MIEAEVLIRANFCELGHLECCVFKSLAQKRESSYAAGHKQQSATIPRDVMTRTTFLKLLTSVNQCTVAPKVAQSELLLK